MENNTKIQLSFMANNLVEVDNIRHNTQKEVTGQKFWMYGDKNIYPQYLFDLYSNVSCLKSIINGLSDYVGGENISIAKPEFQEQINRNGETIEDVVKQIAIDLGTYGGFALNIIRNKGGNIAEIYNINFQNLRSNKDNTEFYYSTDWSKSYGRVKSTVYKKFSVDGTEPSSVFYYKNEKYRTYPSPLWEGAVNSAECLKHISEFHLNSLYNGLSSDYIINFNGGKPTDEQKAEIEESLSEKFTGYNNAGRQMLSFNDDLQHKTTVEALPQTNFIDRYNSLYQTCLKDIFTSFRAHPAIFGLPTDNTGFNSQDLAEAFKLFNTTVILPIQKTIKRCFERIFGEKDVISISPLTISFNEEEIESVDKDVK